jgi:hypothetical protein
MSASANGYELCDLNKCFMKQAGRRLVIVQRVGDGFAASWGFTIWEGGGCLVGECNFDWTADDARSRADSALERIS